MQELSDGLVSVDGLYDGLLAPAEACATRHENCDQTTSNQADSNCELLHRNLL
jgi:hypothetical protein